MERRRVGMIGMGRLGKSLAFSLTELGYRLETPPDRRVFSQDWLDNQDILCLCVRDDQLEDLVDILARSTHRDRIVMMHAGAVNLSLLDPLAERGAVIAKFHPLQAFTQAKDAPIPPDTPWAYEGDIAHLVEPWVTAWGGRLHHLTGDQWRRYHLAAVVAANTLPLLIRAGGELLEPLGDDLGDALDWLKPLVLHSVRCGLDADNPMPFSGPAIRGDQQVLEGQMDLLKEIAPDMVELYRVAAQAMAKRRPGD